MSRNLAGKQVVLQFEIRIDIEEKVILFASGFEISVSKLEFTKVAYFKEVGWKIGRWIDVAYQQRIL